MANTYVNKVVQSDGTVLMDITDTTATADKILSGYTAYGANGEKLTGTASSGGGGAGGVAMIVDTLDAAGGTIREITATELTQAQEGKVVHNGALVSQSSATYTENDTYDTTLVNSVTVDVASSSAKAVYFIDYDGTEVASYTASEFSRLSELPNNPTHTGLTSQGWNWTKSQITSQLTSYPDVPIYVGQMYITSNGHTEIDIELIDSTRLSPYLDICVSGTVEIDWGDNSNGDTVTGSSSNSHNKKIQHTYPAIGNYTISIMPDGGTTFGFYGGQPLKKTTSSVSDGSSGVPYSSYIKEIRLGNGVKIESHAFEYCRSLTSITIPSNVTSINDGSTFQYCHSLKSITIPSGITSINASSFSECCSLASISIPSSVTSIGNYAFSTCYSLTSITIPSGVTSIGTYAFNVCNSLKSITIPSNVTSINDYTFNGCYSLASIIISNGVTSIGTNVFYCCYSLAFVSIPNSVTSIGTNAFYCCYSLASISIPSSVTSIGNYAFYNCCSLISIIIANSTTSIGTYAFYGCKSLKSITKANGITSVNNYMFYDCRSLTSISISSSVTSIGANAFRGCHSFASITIPSGVTSIGTNAFRDCFGIKEYHVLPATPPTLGANNFTGISSDCVIYVPYSEDHSILNAYKAKTNWSSQASKMQEEPQS